MAVTGPARVAHMLALAIQIRSAVEEGIVKDFAVVARLLGVSRQRISTLIRLTFLAPDIQEQILALTTTKRDPITERDVFTHVARLLPWSEQRAAWGRLMERRGAAGNSGPAGDIARPD